MSDGGAEQRRRFETLFASYLDDVVAYCRWRADSPSDAQDAVAEVFLIAWRRPDALPDGGAARAWLYATARRVLANQRRARRRRSALVERLAGQAATAPPGFSEGHAGTTVSEALGRLHERDREVLLLSEWEGLTPREIAGVVGCLEVTARGRLHRARRRFRAVYDELAGGGTRVDPKAFAREVHDRV
jgi:RNA polymerase sigma-70 factor (ECF subfamily)